MKNFTSYHPINLFIYFVGVLFITMFTMNPILLAVSFVSAIVFCGMLVGIKKLLISLAYSVPLMLLTALINPMFVHRGESVLFYLNDNPVTQEALFYGMAMSVMIFSVFYWFRCYNEVVTSDKFIYLFGRLIPKLSLVLSMSLAFIPKFKRQFGEIDSAQKALGIYAQKSIVDKVRSKFRVFSILITWSLENSAETANSMRARGYGLKGRTSYSIFKWTSKDTAFAIFAFITMLITVVIMICGVGEVIYYPVLNGLNFTVILGILYLSALLLMMMSTILEIKENITWRLLRSKI